MFSHERIDAGQLMRQTIHLVEHGWEIREERDHTVVRIEHHSDWHRVERAIQEFRQPQNPSHPQT
jgi:hypothetical protein